MMLCSYTTHKTIIRIIGQGPLIHPSRSNFFYGHILRQRFCVRNFVAISLHFGNDSNGPLRYINLHLPLPFTITIRGYVYSCQSGNEKNTQTRNSLA